MANMDRISIIRNFFFLALVSLVVIYPIKVSALTETPNFPSCLNPNGTIKVSYGSGTHGVPGTSNSYSGKDTVYSQNFGNYTQCLCTVNGDGIQTNWWKISSITEDEINSLKASGWIYVPDGSLWGLEKSPYMAKNQTYSCSSNSSSGDSSSSSSSNDSGSVQGIATRFGQVLGLATTGTLPTILNYFLLGFFSLIMFRLLKK